MIQRRKILFIDDDKLFMESLSELLQLEGYQMLEAPTIEEANHILNNHWVHMMIVDLNMKDRDDDRSGLIIVDNPNYATVPKVILTGYANEPQLIRRTLRPGPGGKPSVVDFVGKNDGEIDKALITAFNAHVFINWELQIHWSLWGLDSAAHLAGFITSREDRAYLSQIVDELEDLLRQLFFHSHQITVGRLLLHNRGVVWIEVFAQGDTGLEQQFIIACGQKAELNQQRILYEQFVPVGNTIGSVRLVDATETLRFAATAYECLGGNFIEMTSLYNFYLRHPAQECLEILNRLFGSTLASWHGQDSSIRDIANFNQLYQIWIKGCEPTLDQGAWMNKLGCLCHDPPAIHGLSRVSSSPEEIILYISETTVHTYPNPLSFLFEEGITLNTTIVFGTVHGNLNLNNVLVDLHEQITWLIDFSQIQKGPVLFDYVALEVALKTELLTMVNIETWCEIERRLLDAKSLGELLVIPELGVEVKKILKMISTIRACAAVAVNQDLRSYLAGLFIHTLTQLANYDENRVYIGHDMRIYQSYLISAALIGQYLTPPREFEPNFRDKFVIVEGRKISKLTKQEWDLLKFLYERAGRPCGFTDILKEVYKDASDDIENGAWIKGSGKPKVNAAIRRLRKKLEPNPDNPRYILTEREYGYRLEK